MVDPIAGALSREADAAADLMAALRTDDAELSHDMIEGETGLIEAISAAIDEIDQCEIITEGCRAKAEEIRRRGERAEMRATRIRALIEQAMTLADLPTARLPVATVTLKSLPPRPVVADESLVPSEFWKPVPPRLDRAALNQAAKAGPIPGVEMTNGSVSLQIRRG